MVLAGLSGYGQEFVIGDYTYEVTSSTSTPPQVKIKGYAGTGGHVEIPETVEHNNNSTNTTYTVTAIGENAFMGKLLTDVTIPEGITHIGIRAFMNNSINNVVIPTNVTSIGHSAFWNNRIASLEIPEGITEIGNNTFGMNILTSVTIPASVETIGDQAFRTDTRNDQPLRMTQVTMLRSTPPDLDDRAFFGTNRNNIHVVVPDGALDAYKARISSDWGGFASMDIYGIFEADDILYRITAIAPNEVRIVDYTGTATELDISGTVDYGGETYTVTVIGEDTDIFVDHVTIRPFHGKDLTRVTIPNTVTRIGLGAFTNNKLEEVVIPNGVTHIRQWGFSGNPLKEVTIPASVEFIGFQAFWVLSSGNPLVRSQGNPPPEIHETAFDTGSDNTTQKIDLVVPFTAIQAYEDAGWRDLGDVLLTAGVTIDEEYKIKYGIVDAPNEATVLGPVSLHLNPVIHSTVDIDGSTYDVTALADNAFYEKDVQTINIPASVRSIGSRALHATFNSLSYVAMEGEDPPTLAPDAFKYPERHDRISVVVEGPKEWLKAYTAAGWTGFHYFSALIGEQHNGKGLNWEVTSLHPDKFELHDFNFGVADMDPDDVDSHFIIDGEKVLVFANGHVNIPKEVQYNRTNRPRMYTVTSIGDHAFNRSYHVPGESAFGTSKYDVFPLTSVTIPEDVTNIGSSAFANNHLIEVVIPNGVTNIGSWAFANNQLTKVTISDALTSIDDFAFFDNNLASVGIPNGVTRIGARAFARNQLTEVTIPGNVTGIGEGAFSHNQLTEVTIPAMVEYVAGVAFENNPDLRLVTVEAEDPPQLHKDAFSNADRGQIDLVVPLGKLQEYLDNGWHGFRSISHGIFTVDGITYGITSPTDVMIVDYTGTATVLEIPETVDGNGETYTVTAIGEMAFRDNQLTEVTLPSSMERIGRWAFYNNPDLALVRIEASDPPVIDATAFSNPDRHEIHLVVPEGSEQAYEDNGWGGFQSISGDDTPPQPTIDAPQGIDDLEPFTVSITFDGGVTDFGVDDIQVTNATVTELTGSGSTYTATIVPASPCGIAIDVPANVAMGVNGVPNPAAQQVVVAAVDTIAPTMACPDDVVVSASNNGTDDCTTTLALVAPIADDNCSVAAVVAQVDGVDIDPDSHAFGVGTTMVTWIVSDATGNTVSCKQAVTVRATRDCGSELLVDFNRGFSPNGDGIADTLVINGLERYRNNVVRIYDLSQRLLFSAHYGGLGDAWDGTHEGGTVPVGPYVCVIDFNEPGLEHETKMIYVNY
ncbi:hypothetical protein FGF1_02790 [Flavobacteriaceae bacterium GF1]